jgi:hypothetical protein
MLLLQQPQKQNQEYSYAEVKEPPTVVEFALKDCYFPMDFCSSAIAKRYPHCVNIGLRLY